MAIVYKIVVKRKRHHMPQPMPPEQQQEEKTVEQTREETMVHEETTKTVRTVTPAVSHEAQTSTERKQYKLTVRARLVAQKEYEKWGRWYKHVKIHVETNAEETPVFWELCAQLPGHPVCEWSGQSSNPVFDIEADVPCFTGRLVVYVKAGSQRASTAVPVRCSHEKNYVPAKPGIHVLHATIRAPAEVQPGSSFTATLVFEKPFRGTVLATLAKSLGATAQGVLDTEVVNVNKPSKTVRIRMVVPSSAEPGTYKIFVTYSGEAVIGEQDGIVYTENVYNGSEPVTATIRVAAAQKQAPETGEEEEKEKSIREKLPPAPYTPV